MTLGGPLEVTMTNQTTNARQLLTVSQVAAMAGVSPETVWRHVRKGALRVRYVGPFRRVRVTVIEARRYAGVDMSSDNN